MALDKKKKKELPRITLDPPPPARAVIHHTLRRFPDLSAGQRGLGPLPAKPRILELCGTQHGQSIRGAKLQTLS